jgi:hypothetical protein
VIDEQIKREARQAANIPKGRAVCVRVAGPECNTDPTKFLFRLSKATVARPLQHGIVVRVRPLGDAGVY